MAGRIIDDDGLLFVWTKIKLLLTGKADSDRVSALENAGYQTETQVTSNINGKLNNYYTKTEVDSKVSSAIRYKGTVATYSDLPTSDQQIGDMYNIQTADPDHEILAGDNVVWSGIGWDKQAGTIDTSLFLKVTDIATTTEIEEIYNQVFGNNETT